MDHFVYVKPSHNQMTFVRQHTAQDMICGTVWWTPTSYRFTFPLLLVYRLLSIRRLRTFGARSSGGLVWISSLTSYKNTDYYR